MTESQFVKVYSSINTNHFILDSGFLNENMVLVLGQLILTIVFLLSQQMFMKKSADGVERF